VSIQQTGLAKPGPAPGQYRQTGPLGFLSVKGPLDGAGVEPVLAQASIVSRTCRCVVVDLRDAELIDSDGVRALLRLAEELESDGKELRIVTRPSSPVRRTLGLLRLTERLQECDSLEEACECWRSGAGLRH
jgi:anti-anti-sigma factor